MLVSDHDKDYCETENTPLANTLASFWCMVESLLFNFWTSKV